MHIENAIKRIRGTSVAHLEPKRKKGIFLYTKSNLVRYNKKFIIAEFNVTIKTSCFKIRVADSYTNIFCDLPNLI